MIVKTREELKEAQEKGVDEIVVIGDLADKLKKSKLILKISAVAMALLIGAVGLLPLTGGASVVVLGPIIALTGLDIGIITAATIIGIGLVTATYNDYEEYSYSPGPPQELVLLKKDINKTQDTLNQKN